ncbi:MAG: hypothetical protein A2293_13840 [Elusimicrobia bacterium RIFOXYB2_FULL_49_7]|nr:MAG: hypothetical protein A2293_13840 [Elusimicrobia bacterium RIFOXYB2_FULL_49_7]
MKVVFLFSDYFMTVVWQKIPTLTDGATAKEMFLNHKISSFGSFLKLDEYSSLSKGFFFLLAAALFFALSTVFLKFATSAPYFVSPATAIVVRFLVAFIIFGVWVIQRREPLRPHRWRLVVYRGIFNMLAVIFFFYGIKYTTVTKSNLLNLTYPAFVFIIAPHLAGEKSKWYHYIFLCTTLLGAALIALPPSGTGFSAINKGDFYSLLSGIVAGFAITILRESRKFDSSSIILFHQMGLGTALSALFLFPQLHMPHGGGLVYVMITSLLAAAGQLFLTVGYKYIPAALGSIVLTSGIFFSTILGITVFNDPLTGTLLIGGTLILFSQIGVSGILEKKTPIKEGA